MGAGFTALLNPLVSNVYYNYMLYCDARVSEKNIICSVITKVSDKNVFGT